MKIHIKGEMMRKKTKDILLLILIIAIAMCLTIYTREYMTHEDVVDAEELQVVEAVDPQVESTVEYVEEDVYLGEFKLTGYCPCYTCSGGWGTKTATGVRATEGITIAVDPKVIPYGTKVYIDGVGFRIAQDCGGAVKGNKIDVFVNAHKDCYKTEYNQKAAKVWIVEE